MLFPRCLACKARQGLANVCFIYESLISRTRFTLSCEAFFTKKLLHCYYFAAAASHQLVYDWFMMIAWTNRAQSVDWRAISRNNWAGCIFCPFPASKVRPWIVIRHQHGAAMDGLCENSDIKRALQMRPSLSKVSDLPPLHCPLLECTALQVTGLHCKVHFYTVPLYSTVLYCTVFYILY